MSLEQSLFSGCLNVTSDDSVTHVLIFLTGGNMNVCELCELFGLCFLVLLFQASWGVTLLILRALLSQRFKDGPLQLSRALFSLCSSLLPAFYHIMQVLAFSASLTFHLCPCHACCVQTAFRKYQGGNHGIHPICFPVLPVTQYHKIIILCILYDFLVSHCF